MTFLFFTLPSNDLGLLAQSLPIARALRERGHRVEFCTPARVAEDAVVRAGFRNHVPRWAPYRMLSGDIRAGDVVRMLASRRALRDVRLLRWAVRHMEENATSEVWNFDHFMFVMGLGNEDYVRASLATLSDVVAAVDPDAVASLWNPLAGVAARLHGKPLISVMQAEAHPSSRGFLWWREPAADLPSPVGVVNRVLRDHGLAPAGSMGELAVGDLTLVPGIPELGPLPDDADVMYVGPLSWDDDDDEATPAWLDALPDDRPVVWVYPGNVAYRPGHSTPFDGRVVVEACVAALADLPLQVVLTTGRLPLPDDLGPLPANFRQADWVPGPAMARRSDLMIHHGGYSSCQAGPLAGTPAVVIPTYSERESNARRLAAAGAGEVLVPDADAGRKRVDPARLREAVERVLSEPSYRENARRIAGIMREYPGAVGAAGLMEIAEYNGRTNSHPNRWSRNEGAR